MSQTSPVPMSTDAFIRWQMLQSERYELVDGRPVAMTGARFGHDRVLTNVIFSLMAHLRASTSQCRPFTSDILLRVREGVVRRPDVAVYCPPFDEAATSSDTPTLIVEILSQSTRHVDQLVKLLEFQTIGPLQYILLISPTEPDVALWAHQPGTGWQLTRLTGMDSMVALPALTIAMPVAEFYDGVTFPALPRLVWPEDSAAP